jgi:glycosyltransferase involved in cell wall biosynthesis
MNTPKLSIIIPAWNEGKTVGLVIERLLKIPFDGWMVEIIAVNDGSTDNTAAVLNGFLNRITVVHLSKNSGKGSAIRAGIEASTGDYAIIQDADLECTPEEIPMLLRGLGDVSSGNKIAVMGSREINEKNKKNRSLSGAGSRFITTLINFLYGSSLTDTLMCYKLFPRAVFSYFGAGGFDAEMIFIARLLKEGYKIVEIPVSYSPRQNDAGKKIRYRDGIRIILKILFFRFTGH